MSEPTIPPPLSDPAYREPAIPPEHPAARHVAAEAEKLGVTKEHAEEIQVLAEVLGVLEGLCCDHARQAVIREVACHFGITQATTITRRVP